VADQPDDPVPPVDDGAHEVVRRQAHGEKHTRGSAACSRPGAEQDRACCGRKPS
jgi:hypothetical protein